MTNPKVFALITALLASRASAAPTTPPIALGEVTFGPPNCGDAVVQNINTSNCATAVSQMLAANCANGLCTIAAPTDGAQLSAIQATVGACSVFVSASGTGGRAVTFEEDAVQAAFPGFISKCVAPGNEGGDGNPMLPATDGILRLGFDNGVVGGG
jgi:uncharacterized protein involved in response to NO